jgi:hypothetical protein
MRELIILINVLAFLLFAGCAKEVKENDYNERNDRPDWIDKPEGNFVGRCATHVKGVVAQEQCAYKKGLAYIAMSKGVSINVSSNMTIKQTATEKTGTSYGQIQATVKMDEKNIRVKASIIDKWHDKASDIMYVLIKEN